MSLGFLETVAIWLSVPGSSPGCGSAWRSKSNIDARQENISQNKTCQPNPLSAEQVLNNMALCCLGPFRAFLIRVVG